MPEAIAVLPVHNGTLYSLDKVVFAGLLQRSLIGGETYDIPTILRGGLEEALVIAGYGVVPYEPRPGAPRPDFQKPLPAGTPAPPFDAALHATILAWESSSGGAPSFSLRYRLALCHVPSGELLYSGDFHCVYRSESRSLSAESVESAIRRCARQSLASLPRKSVESES
jgi:hypothetical protein